MYLWLDGKRIDSIPLLQLYLAGLDEEEKKKACTGIISKYRKGILSEWLTHQEESMMLSHMALYTLLDEALAHIPGITGTEKYAYEAETEKKYYRGDLWGWLSEPVQSETETSIKAQIRKKISFIPRLEKDPGLDLRAAAPAFAEICHVDQAFIEEIIDGYTDETDIDQAALEAIRSQEWFRNDPECLGNIDMKQVVTNSAEFYAKYAGLKENREEKCTFFFCNTGSHFMIPEPGRYRHIRICGYGNPLVRFSCRGRGQKLDLVMNDLTFENVELDCQGMELENKQTGLKGCSLWET